jgi:hypothetical protein
MLLVAFIEYIIALALVMSIAALFYERYLKHKLESWREEKITNSTPQKNKAESAIQEWNRSHRQWSSPNNR